MNAPFKFLDPYDQADRESFFGREDEIEDLYRMVGQNRLVLVYGQSGTGKTSLIQCGLSGKFDSTEWYPFIVKRKVGNDINKALQLALAKPLGGQAPASVTEALAEIYLEYLRPIYLLFDQFEELFILGTEGEQEEFIKTILEIGKTNLPVRILFIIREEYLAHLYHFEKLLPTLFDRRLRVEPISRSKAEEVIRRTCGNAGITLEDPLKMPEAIIENISGKKSGVQLPYLQVYLDRLWKSEQDASAHKEAPQAFKWNTLERVGKIEQVLSEFLREQSAGLEEQLRSKYKTGPGFVRDLLDRFASYLGTKVPLRLEELSFPAVGPEAVAFALDHLERARILRLEEGVYELAHDSLAALIDQNRSDEQRQRNEVRISLESAFREFKKTGEYLSRRQLNSMEEYLPKLDLDPDYLRFVEESKAEATLEEKKKVRRLQWTVGIVSVFAAGAILLSIWAYTKEREASENLKNFQTAQAQKVSSEVKNILDRAVTLQERGYDRENLLLLKEARKLLEVNEDNPLLQSQIQTLDSLIRAYEK